MKQFKKIDIQDIKVRSFITGKRKSVETDQDAGCSMDETCGGGC